MKKSLNRILIMGVFAVSTICFCACSKGTKENTVTIYETESSQSPQTLSSEEPSTINSTAEKCIIDLGEKIIAKEFTSDLGTAAAQAAGYTISDMNEHGYNCINESGEIVFSCFIYDKNISYKLTDKNDILTIFDILPGTNIDEATVTLENKSFECTVDASAGDHYYRYFYVYATDTIIYEIGLSYNPDTMQITDYEISLLDHTQY